MKVTKLNVTRQRRSTPQRRVILKELQALKSHPTAAELFTIVREKLPKISLGTVYRNLEVLCNDGYINKLELSGAETRFDGITDPHLHIRCTGCGKVQDLMDPSLIAHSPEELEGFQVQGCRLEYFGLCPDCRTDDDHEISH